jgi:hypothetical protein
LTGCDTAAMGRRTGGPLRQGEAGLTGHARQRRDRAAGACAKARRAGAITGLDTAVMVRGAGASQVSLPALAQRPPGSPSHHSYQFSLPALAQQRLAARSHLCRAWPVKPACLGAAATRGKGGIKLQAAALRPQSEWEKIDNISGPRRSEMASTANSTFSCGPGPRPWAAPFIRNSKTVVPSTKNRPATHSEPLHDDSGIKPCRH